MKLVWLGMSNLTAPELYAHFVQLINHAVERKNVFSVPEAAEAYGLVGGEEKRGGFGQRWNYSYTDAEGRVLQVHARWWDQSKAFSIQPDKHVMSVELKDGGVVLSHGGDYEE